MEACVRSFSYTLHSSGIWTREGLYNYSQTTSSPGFSPLSKWRTGRRDGATKYSNGPLSGIWTREGPYSQTTSSPGLSPLSKWRTGRRDPWIKLPKSWSICHVTHDEMSLSEVISSDMQSFLFSASNLNPLFKRNEDISCSVTWQNTAGFLEYFDCLVQGFVRPPFWTRRTWGRGLNLCAIHVMTHGGLNKQGLSFEHLWKYFNNFFYYLLIYSIYYYYKRFLKLAR